MKKSNLCSLLYAKYPLWLGLGTRLCVKVPRPGDSEGTFAVFESSCHLLPV